MPAPSASDAELSLEEKIFALIDIDSMRGLEIGPLHNPRLPRDHPNALFMDHATTEELRAKYTGNPEMEPFLDEIVRVDFVWQPGMTLADAVGDAGPFDFVVASHVIEHIPNPIGWLNQMVEILRPGGVVSLIIPDHRYCFDARRDPTTLAAVIDAHLRQLEQPSYEQIFDHEYNYLGEAGIIELWDGLDAKAMRRTDVPDAARYAYDRCLDARDREQFVDVHCTTFTPATFQDIFDEVRRLDLLPFRVERRYDTVRPSLEFYVSLVHTTEPPPPAPPVLAPPPEPVVLGPEVVEVLVSPREVRLIEAKRAVGNGVKRVVHRLRNR